MKLSRTSNFIGSCLHEALLFYGQGLLFLLFVHHFLSQSCETFWGASWRSDGLDLTTEPPRAKLRWIASPPLPTKTSNQLGKSMESRPYTRKDNFSLDHPQGPSGSSLEREELNPAKTKAMKFSPLQFLPGLLPTHGLTSLHQIISFAVTFSYICFKNKLNIPTFVTGILAGLVSITGNKFAMTFVANIFPSCWDHLRYPSRGVINIRKSFVLARLLSKP